MSEQSELMTVEDVASYLRVAERTIYDWAQKGDLPCGKLGASWRFRRSDIDHWLENKFEKKSAAKNSEPILPEDILCESMIEVFEGDVAKEDLLIELVNKISESKNVLDKKALLEGIFQREELMSTGIGFGIAVPHVRIESVKDVVMAVGIVHGKVTGYDSIDNEPVQIVFMIAAGSDQHAKHLKLLSQIAGKFKDKELRKRLVAAQIPQEVAHILL